MEKITVNDLIKISKDDLKGKVICFPTDTVYGLGALYGDREAILKIYKLKKRDLNKPIANLCSNVKQITDLGIEIPSYAYNLIDKHWPGPLTIIFKDGNKKTSFRMPNSKIALKIIDRFSILATTSVNESGEKELNTYEEIFKHFRDGIDYFVTDSEVFSTLPSTVIDVTEEKVKVIREGSIKFN